MSSSGTTEAGRRGRDPTMTPDPRPLPTALTTRPLGRCGMRVPAAVFACTAELLFRAELIVLPTDEENRLEHKHRDNGVWDKVSKLSVEMHTTVYHTQKYAKMGLYIISQSQLFVHIIL